MKGTPDLMYSNDTTALYIDNNGVKALDGTTWTNLNRYLGGVVTNAFEMPANQWTRVIVHDDYVTHRWDMWISTNELDTNYMPRLIGINMAASVIGATQYRGFSFTNSSTTPCYVDNVSITFTKPNYLDSDGDSIPDTYEDTHGLTSATNNTMDTDHDGRTDREEYIAGTDPNDPASFLCIQSVDVADSDPNSIRVVINTAIDADVTVLGSPKPSGARNPIGSFYTGYYGQSNSFTQVNGATNTWFFYQVASSRRGSGVTNTEEFVSHMQSRAQANKYYFVSVPIAGMNNLATELGTYLKRGLSPGDTAYFLTDGVTWNIFELDLDMNWADTYGDPVTDYYVPAGTGIRLLKKSTSSGGPRASFFGRRDTNQSVTVTVPANSWTFRAWPFDSTTNYYATTTNTTVFGFPSSAGGAGTNDSDIIWTYRQDGALICLRMGLNNKWYYYGTGIGEATGVVLNGGFWYNNNHTEPMIWTPQKPQ
jgi:hypothetical protein